MESGYAMAKRLLESGKEFTCIYAISDSAAVGACKALFNAGKKIPDDYSVASFDGLPMTEYYEPSITTMRQPRKEMAEATIKLLFDLIRKKPVEFRQVYEAELVVRQSTKRIR